MPTVRECLLLVPLTDPDQRPLLMVDNPPPGLEAEELNPFHYRVHVSADESSRSRWPTEGVLAWYEPASPVIVAIQSVAARTSKYLSVTCVVPADHLDVVFRSLLATIQQVHASRSPLDSVTAHVELVQFLERDVSLLVRAKHRRVVQETHDLLSLPDEPVAARQISAISRWRGELAAVGAMRCGLPPGDPLEPLLSACSSELSELLGCLQTQSLERLVALQEQQALARETAEDAQRAAESRVERLIARLGLAAVLPGLWLTYWGANITPKLDPLPGTLLVILGTVVLAAVGEYLGYAIWTRAEKGR